MGFKCRLCLKEIISTEFSVALKYCQAFNDNPVRLNLFKNACQQFSLEVLENDFLHKICSDCDTSLLSTAVFVENCIKASQYFKSLTYNEYKYDLDSIKEIPLNHAIGNKKESDVFENDQSNVKNNNSTKCSFCGRKFRNIGTLEKHVTKFHSNVKKNPTLKELKSTTDDFFNEFFQCHHCELFFKSKQLLRLHIKGHEKNNITCFCDICFKHGFKLNSQCLEINGTEDSRLDCHVCGKTFKSSNSLEYHQNIHRNIKPFPCSACDESFFSPNSLKKHQRLLHCITKDDCKKQQFLCDNCGVSFSRRYHLKRHRIIRHTNPPLAFPCEICGKAFVDQCRLRAHLLIHTDQRNFECAKCDRAFRTQSARQSHTSRVHLNLRPFPCPTCTKAFKSKSHLKKHIRTHTGEKPFSCPFCLYQCAEHSNLKKHLKIHERQ